MQRATPLLWLLFSAGGTLAALLYPVHLALVGLAIPLGLLERPGHGLLRQRLQLEHDTLRPQTVHSIQAQSAVPTSAVP